MVFVVVIDSCDAVPYPYTMKVVRPTFVHVSVYLTAERRHTWKFTPYPKRYLHPVTDVTVKCAPVLRYINISDTAY